MATKVKVVLDRSGSMTTVAPVTVDKFNEYIQSVASDRGKEKITVSLYQFDDRFQTDYEDVPVQDVEPLVLGKTYQPRGMTALLDAIGKTMADAKLKKKEKGICVIITDGYENSSKEYTQSSIASLIADLEDNDKWTFVYLGANQDAWAIAQSFGIRTQDKALAFGGTAEGWDSSYQMLASATTRYSHHAGARGMSLNSTFFEKEEQEEAEKTKRS